MFSDQSLQPLDLQVESITGKLLPIRGQKISSRLAFQLPTTSTSILHSVIIPLDGPFMVILKINSGLGQLRRHSNASGPQYGKRFKKEGTLGVYLNMNKGTLAFSLNGESMGIAFTDAGLTKGPIYPTVSLLHCAGCLIKGELPIPSMFQNM